MASASILLPLYLGLTIAQPSQAGQSMQEEAVPASQPKETPTPRTTQKEKDGDEVICKKVRVVNSRIPGKVCMTRSEYEIRQRETIEEKRRMRNRNSYCPASGPC